MSAGIYKHKTGWKHPEITKRKISESLTGKKASKETREKMRLSRLNGIKKGRIKIYGKGKTYEEIYGIENALIKKRKISKFFKGKKLPPFTKEHRKKLALSHIGMKASKITKEKMSRIHKGKNHHFFGKICSKERKRKIGLANEGKYPSKKTRKKLSLHSKLQWKDLKYRNKVTKAIREGLKQKPTLPERQIIQIIEINKLPFNYTGDGKVILNGFNPDFLSKNPKHIIEMNGEYWHRDKSKEIRKKKAYNSLGYKLLVIWSKELENPQKVTEKIINFWLK